MVSAYICMYWLDISKPGETNRAIEESSSLLYTLSIQGSQRKTNGCKWPLVIPHPPNGSPPKWQIMCHIPAPVTFPEEYFSSRCAAARRSGSDGALRNMHRDVIKWTLMLMSHMLKLLHWIIPLMLQLFSPLCMFWINPGFWRTCWFQNLNLSQKNKLSLKDDQYYLTGGFPVFCSHFVSLQPQNKCIFAFIPPYSSTS